MRVALIRLSGVKLAASRAGVVNELANREVKAVSDLAEVVVADVLFSAFDGGEIRLADSHHLSEGAL